MATASVPHRMASPFPARTVSDDGRLCVRIPRSAATLAGFRAWVKSQDFPEHVRVTFVDGEIYYDMSNEELETHNQPKSEVLRVLMNLNRKLKLGRYYGDGVLVTNEAAEVSNNPDGTFIRAATLQSGRVRLVAREGVEGHYVEIVGIPDMVLEIVSAGSVRKDTQQLRAAYHRAGIPEYWLIDARQEEISFQILHWQRAAYKPGPGTGSWQQSHVFNRRFRLTRQRNELDLWEYTLQVRAAGERKRKP
jgi:Uma2 family endonuclease